MSSPWASSGGCHTSRLVGATQTGSPPAARRQHERAPLASFAALNRCAACPHLPGCSCHWRPAALHRTRYYKSTDEPLLNAAQLAALAAGEASEAGGKGGRGAQGQQAQQAELLPEERVARVPPELKAQLAHYRWASCLSYDFPTGLLVSQGEGACAGCPQPWLRLAAVHASPPPACPSSCLPTCQSSGRPLSLPATDEALSEQLASRGYALLAACHAADLASSCPAYFLALRHAWLQLFS